MSAAAAPAPPGISVCSAPTCQPIAACTIEEPMSDRGKRLSVCSKRRTDFERLGQQTYEGRQSHADARASLQPCRASRCAMDIHRMMQGWTFRRSSESEQAARGRGRKDRTGEGGGKLPWGS